MKKNTLPLLLLAAFVCLTFSCKDKKTQTENEVAAVRTKEYRSVTVINNTAEKLMAECTLTTASGARIAHRDLNTDENIVFKDFDKNDAFETETQFKITLVDRHGIRYEHTFEANETGNTDVTITEDDYVRQSGDLFRKIQRALN